MKSLYDEICLWQMKSLRCNDEVHAERGLYWEASKARSYDCLWQVMNASLSLILAKLVVMSGYAAFEVRWQSYHNECFALS